MTGRRVCAWLLIAAAACHAPDSRRERADGPLIAALRRHPPQPSSWGVRFSISTTPDGCWAGRGDTLFDLACGAAHIAPTSELASIAARAATAVRGRIDADAIHAAALIDIVSGDSAGNVLDRSVSYLEMVTQLDPGSSAAFADLAAAHLITAARRGDAFELLQGLDAASRAVELDSTNDAGRFNRALALDLLAIDGEAAAEWRRYLRRDSTSAWATRARRHLSRGPARSVAPPPAPDASDSALSAFASTMPFDARAFAWERLLGGWGEAVVANDTSRAARRLHAASVVGASLARQFGDSSIASAVRSVAMASAHPAPGHRLARLHASFAQALGMSRVNDHARADSAYTAIAGDAAASPELRQWATHGHANSLVYAQRSDDAVGIAERLLREIDERRQPSLAARAHWLVGMVRLRLGDLDAGARAVNDARRGFAWAGERENDLGAIGVAGELALRTGDDVTGYARIHAALRGLRDYPTSIWRHNLLYVLAGRATLAELDRAAEAIEAEDFAVSAAANRSASVVEARLARARSLWQAGDTARARAVIDTTIPVIASLPGGATAKGRFQAELSLTLATGPLRADPARAYTLLDSVVAFYTPPPPRRPDAARLVPAIIARANAALAVGNVTAAEADLTRAAAIYEQQRDSLSQLPMRVALLASARSAFESLVLVRLAQKREAEALDALERSRAFSTSAAVGSPTIPRPSDGRRVVDYALIADTLFTWVVDSADVSVTRSVVGRARFADVLARTRAGFELGASDSTLRPLLEQLYEWLVRPAEQQIGRDSTPLVVVADRDLASVPMAALFDARRGTYLVESRVIRFSSTLRDAVSSGVPGGTEALSGAALFVANPDVDRDAFPALADLPYSETEVQRAAALYPRARVVTGAAVDSTALVQALPNVSLFHFAGHAVFDDARPERSRLVVRPRGVPVDAIASLDLGRVRLVVLSACESMGISEHRGGGFAGLAEAFLAAGVGGVVGSAWRVDDAATAELMPMFHAEYRKSAGAAAALRYAQLALLRSSRSANRSPVVWGAFRYHGR